MHTSRYNVLGIDARSNALAESRTFERSVSSTALILGNHRDLGSLETVYRGDCTSNCTDRAK